MFHWYSLYNGQRDVRRNIFKMGQHLFRFAIIARDRLQIAHVDRHIADHRLVYIRIICRNRRFQPVLIIALWEIQACNGSRGIHRARALLW